MALLGQMGGRRVQAVAGAVRAGLLVPQEQAHEVRGLLHHQEGPGPQNVRGCVCI